LQGVVNDPTFGAIPTGPDAKTAITVDVPEAITFIRASTKKMDGLINAILKLSREGQRNLSSEPVDLGVLFDGISASVQHRLTETGGELRIERPLGVIMTDRLALEQIFGNIVDNAVKYRSPARAPIIDVRMRGQPGGQILIEVQDNGRGISEQDHD